MADIVITPDVESLVLDVLNTSPHVAVPWGTQIPVKRPKAFGRVTLVGGPMETRVSSAALVTLESWAVTETDAQANLNIARGVILAEDSALFGCRESSGVTNFPDVDIPSPRYRCTVEVRVRGTVLA